MNQVFARLLIAVASVVFLVIGIHEFPQAEYWDEFWFGGAWALGLLALVPWPSN